jgi:hypothetical protein
MSDTSPLPEPVVLPAAWVGLDSVPIQLGNAFAGQIAAPGEIIFSVGQMAPPFTTGTPEEQAIQIKNTPFVTVRPLGRYSLTTKRVQELINILQQTLENHARVEESAARRQIS